MESLDQNINLERNKLVVNAETSYHFEIAGKWAKFLAIMGFISSGLIAISGIFMLIAATSMPFSSGYFLLIGCVYLVMGGVLLFPAIYLLRYSNSIQRGMMGNQMEFDLAIKNLKALFKFTGIYTIVIIGAYIIFGITMALLNSPGGRF